jgi:hypothetical protein
VAVTPAGIAGSRPVFGAQPGKSRFCNSVALRPPAVRAGSDAKACTWERSEGTRWQRAKDAATGSGFPGVETRDTRGTRHKGSVPTVRSNYDEDASPMLSCLRNFVRPYQCSLQRGIFLPSMCRCASRFANISPNTWGDKRTHSIRTALDHQCQRYASVRSMVAHGDLGLHRNASTRFAFFTTNTLNIEFRAHNEAEPRLIRGNSLRAF